MPPGKIGWVTPTVLAFDKIQTFLGMSRSEIFGSVRLQYKTLQIFTNIRSNKNVFRTSALLNLLFMYLHPVDLSYLCLWLLQLTLQYPYEIQKRSPERMKYFNPAKKTLLFLSYKIWTDKLQKQSVAFYNCYHHTPPIPPCQRLPAI